EYWISPDGTDDMEDHAQTVEAVDQAFQSWECVPCSTIEFRNMGGGPIRVDQDGKNAVVWMGNRSQLQQLLGADPDGMLATTVNFDPDARPYFEQDIIFNDTTFHGDDLRWTNNP